MGTNRLQSSKPRTRANLVLVVLLSCLALLLTQCDLPVSQPGLAIDIPDLSSAAAEALAPRSLDNVLGAASLIVVGEIGPVVRHIDFAVYGEDGQLLTERPIVDNQGNRQGDIPATDFEIVVERVLRDDGRVASGEPIILRMGGTVTEEVVEHIRSNAHYETLEYPPSFTGDKGLFLLAPQPDGKAYGFQFGPWSRLVIDGDVLRRTDGTQELLQFAGSDEPITLEMLEAAIDRPEAAYVPYVPPVSGQAPPPPLPTGTPVPEFDPVLYHMNRSLISYEEAVARVEWLDAGGQRWVDDVDELTRQLQRENPDFEASWMNWGPDFHFYVRLSQPDPDEEAFREQYLQRYEWADKVTLLGLGE